MVARRMQSAMVFRCDQSWERFNPLRFVNVCKLKMVMRVYLFGGAPTSSGGLLSNFAPARALHSHGRSISMRR
jgi:hypothetical protein